MNVMKSNSMIQSLDVAQPVRVKWPIRLKITLPYLFLALVVAAGVTLLFWRVALETVDERFTNQLYESSQLTADAMLAFENDQVETLRLLSNTQGVAGAVLAGDAEQLRTLALGIAVNNQAGVVEFLDNQGNLVLAMRQVRSNNSLDYEYIRGGPSVHPGWTIVQNVLAGAAGSTVKFSDLIRADWGTFFYTAGPILDANNQRVGVMLVGTPLTGVTRALREATLAQITLYDFNGQVISSTFPSNSHWQPLSVELVDEILAKENEAIYRRDAFNRLLSNGMDYGELLTPWQARDGSHLGVVGTALLKNILITATLPTRIWLISLVFLTVMLIVLIGINISNVITRPIVHLMEATRTVAGGNLNVHVEKETNDEIAILAESFNMMVHNLQQSQDEIISNYDNTLEGWARILEMRDKETSGHSQRVLDLTMAIAPLMGIPPDQMEHLRRGVLLHDIGKLGVPDSILLKPGPLTPDEWLVMRKHPLYAYEMLKNIPYLAPAVEVPYCHHEWWNGKGYPRQLIGESIPLAARVFSLVDAWDALTTDRPYRAKMTPVDALGEITSQSGQQFDPRLVDIFRQFIQLRYLGMQ